MRWLAIANPAAGRPRTVRRAVHALAGLPGIAVDMTETRAPGDATRMAREAARYDGVIAIGGDGTIGEVINGMALERQVLAVLPAGHGNCLARDLGVGRLARALEALREPRVAPLDLLDTHLVFGDGREGRRWCASTLAAGYVTQVVVTGRSRLAWLGGGAYAVAAMLTSPAPFALRFDAAGEAQRRTGIVINNTMHLSNFRGLPHASVRDGLLDIMELDAAWPRQLLHNLSVLTGSPRFGPAAIRQRRGVGVSFDVPLTVMADGELLPGVRMLDVECRGGAARCVVGAR
jgi:diacylglycerol kinase (ATP)